MEEISLNKRVRYLKAQSMSAGIISNMCWKYNHPHMIKQITRTVNWDINKSAQEHFWNPKRKELDCKSNTSLSSIVTAKKIVILRSKTIISNKSRKSVITQKWCNQWHVNSSKNWKKTLMSILCFIMLYYLLCFIIL